MTRPKFFSRAFTVALSATVMATALPSLAADDAAPRIGLGQRTAQEPAQLSNLRLTDPLVQQKYLNEPDMLRFLRGTYSEACARGMLDQAAKQVKADLRKEYSQEQRDAAASLIDSRRIWKMTSFEMEALYGAGYLNAANYCDCTMREISDADLVNPRKGIEVIEKLPQSVVAACQTNAKDLTARQVKARAALKKAAKAP